MTVGTNAYKGLSVPLQGESEIRQLTAATDILTITGASGQSGDFLVCRIAAGTEKFSVDVSGNVVAAGGLTTSGVLAGTYLKLTDGSAAPGTLALTADGMVGVATVSGTIRLYARSGGTIAYADCTAV